MRCLWVCTALVAVGVLGTTSRADQSDGDTTTYCAATPSLCEACERCDDCAECCDSFNQRRRIFGFLPSDHCFDRFISPISNPFFFEDPRSLTEIRGIFIDNDLPGQPIGPGDAQIWTAQFRGRVTDRWSVIAPRLSYFQVNGDGNPPSGFLSAPVGAKFNFIRDVENQFLVSAGMTYFIPGSPGAVSNFGNGDVHLFLTGGKQIFGRGHWLSGSGFRLPEDRNWGTQMWYWSNQWDYELPGHLYPLIGLNWFHFMDSAGSPQAQFTTLDIINLPAGGVAGSNVVTSVIGARWKPSGHVEVGFGWEYPLTQNGDVLKNRVYTDLIFRY
jgi:hypothetical protein